MAAKDIKIIKNEFDLSPKNQWFNVDIKYAGVLITCVRVMAPTAQAAAFQVKDSLKITANKENSKNAN